MILKTSALTLGIFLVVSSTSSDTSDYDFDHSESTGEEVSCYQTDIS